MAVNTKSQGKSWQNTLCGMTNKLNALFHDEYISDLTITFPGSSTKYKAHKVILGMASSVFEQMLFGPMAITGSELELSDDDPSAFKIVLVHCYEVNIELSNIDEVLEVYLLADKYFLEELSTKVSKFICSNLDRDNIEKVLDFSNKFNFGSLKDECYNYIKDKPELLINLSQEWLKELLKSNINPESLNFVESWRNPNETLKEDAIIQIIKSNNCKNPGLSFFAGCVSPEVVHNVCWEDLRHENIYPELQLSFNNHKQFNDILNYLEDIKYEGWLSLHLQCYMIPVCRLIKILPLPVRDGPRLYLLNVDDNGIEWAATAIKSLRPVGVAYEGIYLPKSELTEGAFWLLLKKMSAIFADVNFPDVLICSSNIPSNKEKEFKEWAYSKKKALYIGVFDENEDMDYW